jgi:hypothetical protein
MGKANRARTAATLKQPSLCLLLRAPHFYPDQRCGNATANGEVCALAASRRAHSSIGASKRSGQNWRATCTKARTLISLFIESPHCQKSLL